MQKRLTITPIGDSSEERNSQFSRNVLLFSTWFVVSLLHIGSGFSTVNGVLLATPDSLKIGGFILGVGFQVALAIIIWQYTESRSTKKLFAYFCIAGFSVFGSSVTMFTGFGSDELKTNIRTKALRILENYHQKMSQKYAIVDVLEARLPQAIRRLDQEKKDGGCSYVCWSFERVLKQMETSARLLAQKQKIYEQHINAALLEKRNGSLGLAEMKKQYLSANKEKLTFLDWKIAQEAIIFFDTLVNRKVYRHDLLPLQNLAQKKLSKLAFPKTPKVKWSHLQKEARILQKAPASAFFTNLYHGETPALMALAFAGVLDLLLFFLSLSGSNLAGKKLPLETRRMLQELQAEKELCLAQEAIEKKFLISKEIQEHHYHANLLHIEVSKTKLQQEKANIFKHAQKSLTDMTLSEGSYQGVKNSVLGYILPNHIEEQLQVLLETCSSEEIRFFLEDGCIEHSSGQMFWELHESHAVKYLVSGLLSVGLFHLHKTKKKDGGFIVAVKEEFYLAFLKLLGQRAKTVGKWESFLHMMSQPHTTTSYQ